MQVSVAIFRYRCDQIEVGVAMFIGMSVAQWRSVWLYLGTDVTKCDHVYCQYGCD
jgi:hypothetical protein